MNDSFIYKNERPWPNARLKRAAIVGHTTASAARVWVRAGEPGKFQLHFYPVTADTDKLIHASMSTSTYQPADPVQSTDPEVVDFSTDTTVVFELVGLEAGTEYAYALYSLDKQRVVIGHDRQHKFYTLPAQEESPYSFGFYSCHMPYKKTLFGNTKLVNMDLWDGFNAMLENHKSNENSYKRDLRFVIAGGDQVYSDGIETLSIWAYLNKVMHKQGDEVFPTVETMSSWYRDIYRGYWGFNAVKKAFSSAPTYMIWDDHELGDGWGSFILDEKPRKDELKNILKDLADKGLSREDGLLLLERMKQAGYATYKEYQHCHNPKTPADEYDYHFSHSRSAWYVLDGRGYRDVNRSKYKILGEAQYERFINYVEQLDPAQTDFLFVVSAVPMLHLSATLVNKDKNFMIKKLGLTDDLRDGWEHKLHNKERKGILKALYKAAAKGIRICILSGDVHTSAVFKMKDPATDSVIYQLTSSAITYNVGRPLGWILGAGVPDDGTTDDGYEFKRLALYTDSNFSLIKIDEDEKTVTFQLYGDQSVGRPDQVDASAMESHLPVPHSIAKIELHF